MSDNITNNKSNSGGEHAKRESDFFEKKGFYIVLAICVVLVAVTAIYVGVEGFGFGKPENADISGDGNLSSSLSADENGDADEVSLSGDRTIQEVIGGAGNGVNDGANDGVNDNAAGNFAGNAEISQTGGDAAHSGSEAAGDLQEADRDGVTDTDNADETDAESISSEEAAAGITFDMPVIGQVTQEYAMDRLIYSKTLAQWQTHGGIDLGAALGTAVKASADGVVTEIKDDPKYGVTVIIEHDGGYRTLYANLASGEAVLPNQIVKSGDVIGAVGDSAVYEKAETTHLHFEIWKDDICIDPTQMLAALKAKS